MKTLVIAMLCVAAGFSLRAQETKRTEDLVTAAKQSKAKRKKPTTKVITNKDVRKSKAKLIELPPSKKPTAKAASIPTIAEQDTHYRARQDADQRLTVAEKNVDKLKKELDTIEQRYYEENDPNYRDNVIQQRFQQTRRQLDDAQRELADARDAVKKLTLQK